MLQKRKELRKVEFTFTDSKIHPECHVEYNMIITEDDKEIAITKSREVKSLIDVKEIIQSSKEFVHELNSELGAI